MSEEWFLVSTFYYFTQGIRFFCFCFFTFWFFLFIFYELTILTWKLKFCYPTTSKFVMLFTVFLLKKKEKKEKKRKKGKLWIALPWFDRNLSYLHVIKNLTLYSLEVWSKFKLFTYSLKFHDTSVLLDSFWNCIFIFFVFLEKRGIKVE